MNYETEEDVRTCSVCGCDLFPNYMEGCWEHFTKNGCRFQGMASRSRMQPQYNQSSDDLVGPWRSQKGQSK